MAAMSRWTHIVISADIFPAGSFQHIDGTLLHILAHGHLIFLKLAINIQRRKSPFVGFIKIEAGFVFIIRKMFPPGSDSHSPLTGNRIGLFEFYPYTANTTYSPTSVATALISEAPHVITSHGILAYIPETGDVNSVGSSPVEVLIFESIEPTPRPYSKMMIHQIVPHQFAGIAKTIGEGVGGAVKQNPASAQRGGIQEDNFGVVFLRFIGFSIENPYSCSLSGIFIV